MAKKRTVAERLVVGVQRLAAELRAGKTVDDFIREGRGRRYRFVIEKAGRNYSGHIEGLPGCVATGKTREQTRRRLRSAMKMHLEEQR